MTLFFPGLSICSEQMTASEKRLALRLAALDDNHLIRYEIAQRKSHDNKKRHHDFIIELSPR